MAKTAEEKTPTGRTVESLDAKPDHIKRAGGPGKSRQPTEFDDLIPVWYEEGKVKKIPAQGETDEDKLSDLDNMYKAVAKAAAAHNLGVWREKENDPEHPQFTGYNLYVQVRDRQASRGRPRGSIKDPETGKFVSPDDETGRYQELKALKDAGEL